MKELIRRLEEITRIGDPQARAKAAYDLATNVRNFAGELAYKMANKREAYGELAATFPEVKRAGKAMVKAMESFSDAVFKTEKSVNVKFSARDMRGLPEDTLDEALTLGGVKATLDRAIGNAKKLAGRFDKTVMAGEFKKAMEKAADDLDNIADHVHEDVITERAQPKLNKYDPGSLLGWVIHLLEKYNLDDAADDVKRVSKSVSKAWQERER